MKRSSESEEQIMTQWRHTFLGDRLLVAMLGSAPTSPEILSFLKRCFEVPFFNAYGLTESAILTFEDKIDRNAVRIGIEAPHEISVYREEIAPHLKSRPEHEAVPVH